MSKLEADNTFVFGEECLAYKKADADRVIAAKNEEIAKLKSDIADLRGCTKLTELKAGVLVTPHNEGMCFHRGSDAVAVTEGETEFYLKPEADKCIAEQKAKADRLLSCIKYLVMRDLIKDCPSKQVASEIVKEYE